MVSSNIISIDILHAVFPTEERPTYPKILTGCCSACPQMPLKDKTASGLFSARSLRNVKICFSFSLRK